MSSPKPPPRPDGVAQPAADPLDDSDLVSEVSMKVSGVGEKDETTEPDALIEDTQATVVASPLGSRPRQDSQTGLTAQLVGRRSAADLGPRQYFSVGRYHVHQSIASGGMASVHLGRLSGAAGFSRTVAIKRMHPHFAQDPDFQDMFIDEVRLAARIQDPNVVATLDVVSDEGELLLVMEYVHGEALSRLLRTAVRANELVAPEITVAVMSGVLHGLHAAHEATNRFGEPIGIVHRDVSPQNVLVGADGVARVLDFGVAKATGCVHTTREGLVRGKAAYMAPEQLRGEAVDRRTDIYSAGIVLWEMLVGDRMFDTSEPGALKEVMDPKIDPPSTRITGLPPAFDGVVMRALNPDVTKRYSTALEMADALESCTRVASRTEVRQWLERLAGEALGRRAELVALVESAGDSAPPLPRSGVDSAAGLEAKADPNTAQGIATESTQRSAGARTRGFTLAIAVAAAVVFGVGLWALRSGPEPQSGARPPASGPVLAPSSPPALATAPIAEPTPSAASSAATSAGPPEAPSAEPAPPPKRGRLVRPRRKATKPGCNPPYFVTSDGVKRYKPQCF